MPADNASGYGSEPPVSAVPPLVEWALARPCWVQALVAEVIAFGDELSPDRVHALLDLLEQEEILGVLPSPNGVLPLALPRGSPGNEGALLLLEIRDTVNVNALAENQAIEFHPKLTVIFGENGAGKSGYTRILKCAAKARAIEVVLPDVGRSSDSSPAVPTATIRIRVGDEDRSLVWKNDVGLPPLTRIDIFDSRSAPQHVDPNLGYVYTPRELTALRFAQHALDAVQEALAARIAERSGMPKPSIAANFAGTRAQGTVDSLGPDADLSAIEELASVSPGELLELDALEEEAHSLQGKTLGSEIALCSQDARLLARIQGTLERAAAFDLEQYRELRKAKAAAIEERDHTVAEQVVPSGHDASHQEAWAAWAEAGETYLAATGRSGEYPRELDMCIYCQQALSPDARAFLARVRGSALRSAERAVAVASSAFASHCGRLVLPGASALLTEVRASADGDRATARVFSGTIAVIERVLGVVDAVSRGEDSVLDDLDTSEAMKAVVSERERLEGLVQTLRSDNSARSTKLEVVRARMTDIEARQELARLLPEIRGFVESKRWERLAVACKARFQGHARALTAAAKKASDVVLNQQFTERFAVECQALNAPKVRLSFPAREAEVLREKKVGKDTAPSRVLSEGEQRSLSLADFLAEVALKTPLAPVIFDDPVNSLDARRIGLVASRIAALSEERQVVVFTHSIPFAAELLDNVEKPKGRFLYYEVERDGSRAGAVVRLESPRMDSPKALEQTIRETIARAEAEKPGEMRRVFVKKGYDHLRSLCEVVIENEIFGNVVRRFRRNVMVGSLTKLAFPVLEEVCTEVEALFARICGIIDAHSQPDDVIGVQWNLDDLKADMAALSAVRERLKKPQKQGAAKS